MAMGLVGLIIGVAPAIGPVLSGILVDYVGWRIIFVLVAALAVATIVLAFFVLPNYDKIRRSKFDALSVVLSTIGLFSLLYGISTFSSPQNHLFTAAMVVVGVAVMGVYCKRQLSLDDPNAQPPHSWCVPLSPCSDLRADCSGDFSRSRNHPAALHSGSARAPGHGVGSYAFARCDCGCNRQLDRRSTVRPDGRP